jgi:hypothetical protein
MLSLQDIPDELIIHMVSFLRVLSVKRLAQTFCKRITYICLPILTHRPVSWKENDRKMMALFGEISNSNEEYIIDMTWNIHEACLGPYSPPSAVPVERLSVFEYLNYREDLTWLRPVPDDSVKERDLTGAVLSAADMFRFQELCEQLDLMMPKLRFMTDENLIHHLSPSFMHFELLVQPISLIRMKSPKKFVWSGQEGLIDGYAFQFACNEL